MSESSEPTAADAAVALATLKTIGQHSTPELLLLAMQSDNTFDAASAQTTEPLANVLRQVALNHAEEYSESATMAYGDATEVSEGHVMWIPVRDVPLLLAEALDREAADLPQVALTPQFIRRLQLSVIRVPTDGGHALFYRKLGPSAGRGYAGKVPVFQRGDRFDVVNERTVVLDRQVDAVVVGGFAFFDNRRRFQRVFGLMEELQERAGQTFDDVTAGLRIANLDALRQAATTQLQMLGKLASIDKKLKTIPAYREAMTTEKLVAFIQAHPYTEVEIEGQGSEAKLVFQPDGKHRFKILKLLDDDYLQSQLTELSYESNSKGLPLPD